jgi:protease-4
MKDFFKYLLATVLGGLIVAFLFFFIAIGIVAGIASMGDAEVKIKENTLLILKLEGAVVERASNDPFEDVMSNISGTPATEGLNQILANIEKAKRDSNIKGILLEAGMLSAGYATIEEIRNALIDFKESGKFIYSFAPIYTQKAYYLASVADKVYLTPGGMLEFKGINSEQVYFKGALNKLGIEMQVFKHGKYKSAVEPFINDKMSDASREQTQVYIGSIWNHLLKKVAEARSVDQKQLDAFANEMPMFRNQQLLIDNGLIDGLKYKDEVIDELKEKLTIKQSDDINAVTNKKYAKVYVEKAEKGIAKDKIAVIYAEGEIDGASKGIDSEKLSKTIREARRDSSIKAIVLRINSPGGSALGSEIIWREVKLAKETKPLIVSMGDLAASGGYYIACAADTIIAHPTTLTGSIGIFGMIPNTKGLTDKLGITFDGAKTNKFADMPALNRPFNSDEKEIMQAYIEMGYDLFIGRCADGRNTSKAAIDSVGQGRVWTGENATSLKLVDELGGIKRAIEVAKNRAGLTKYRIVELPAQEDPFAMLMKDLSGDARAYLESAFLGEDAKYLQTLRNLRSAYPIQTRMPFDLNVN